jgi:hypothetical protein
MTSPATITKYGPDPDFGPVFDAELDTIFGDPPASCCYQRHEIIVRDSAPESGPDPAP